MRLVRSRLLPPLGILLVALSIGLRQFLLRSGPNTDFSDFALGTLVGIGLGLMILGIWLNRPTAAAR
jgi:hypothetical protein